MRTTQQVEEVRTVSKTVAHTCDVCGRDLMVRLPDRDATEVRHLAGLDQFGELHDDVDVTARLSCGWPEGGDSVTYEADICALCFLTKIVPFIESQRGNAVRRTTSDW